MALHVGVSRTWEQVCWSATPQLGLLVGTKAERYFPSGQHVAPPRVDCDKQKMLLVGFQPTPSTTHNHTGMLTPAVRTHTHEHTYLQCTHANTYACTHMHVACTHGYACTHMYVLHTREHMAAHT